MLKIFLDAKKDVVIAQKLLNGKNRKKIEDLNKIHKSQDHIRCKCTKCGRIQENKNVYNYYAQKQCFCQSKSTTKPLD